MNRQFRYLILIVSMVSFSHSAFASLIYYNAKLDGPSEATPNASPGTGSAEFWLDSDVHTLKLDVTFSGLLGTTTAAHIHAATSLAGTGAAGVATQLPSFIGFPLGVTSGSYSRTFDTLDPATFNPAFVAANGGTPLLAQIALFQAIADGKAYLNIHTTSFGGGEIRGFLKVPEPAITTLMTLGVLGFLFAKRRAA